MKKLCIIIFGLLLIHQSCARGMNIDQPSEVTENQQAVTETDHQISNALFGMIAYNKGNNMDRQATNKYNAAKKYSHLALATGLLFSGSFVAAGIASLSFLPQGKLRTVCSIGSFLTTGASILVNSMIYKKNCSKLADEEKKCRPIQQWAKQEKENGLRLIHSSIDYFRSNPEEFNRLKTTMTDLMQLFHNQVIKNDNFDACIQKKAKLPSKLLYQVCKSLYEESLLTHQEQRGLMALQNKYLWMKTSLV